MLITTHEQIKKRISEIKEIDLSDLEERKCNQKNGGNFTQVTSNGWARVRELMDDKKGSASVRLYTFLAEHLDPTCGAVLADQQFLAEKLNVSTRTIIRWVSHLEKKGALVKIPVSGKLCAYALNPNEVWKGYNTSKPYAAFVTKTLVNKNGDIQRKIKSMFSAKEKKDNEA